MERQIRTFDVGLDGNAQSYLVDTTTAVAHAGSDIELWQSFKPHAVPAHRDAPFYPPSGETLFRFFALPPPPPRPEDVNWAEVSAQFFKANEIEACRSDSARHPLMHRTPTSDCVILLEGRVQLILDQGEPIDLHPFDVIRQRSTNHAWVNLGPGPALLVSLMHGNPASTQASQASQASQV
jgi:hypothetical protein